MSVHQTGQSDGDDVYPDGFRSAIVLPKSARHCKSALFTCTEPKGRAGGIDGSMQTEQDGVHNSQLVKTARSHSALVSTVQTDCMALGFL